jgi:hypothetical protein
MKNVHIATSPLTGTIFCGTVLKDGRTWGANKKDPLFYNQMVGPALEKDQYTLACYQQRQRDIEQMHRKVAVKTDQL